MNISVNAKTIKEVLDDKKFKDEIIEFLTGIVDEELEKAENMNTALIEECTEIIFELENGYEEMNIDRETADKIVKFCQKKIESQNKRVRFRKMAAVVAVAAVVLTASVPVFADSYDEVFSYIIQLFEKDEDEYKGESKYSSMTFDAPAEYYDVVIKSKDEIMPLLEKYRFEVIPMEGEPFTVPLSECEVEIDKKPQLLDGENRLSVKIKYKDEEGDFVSCVISYVLEEE